MSKARNKGMRAGAVSLWLMLLLSERPMYGYELIRELEKDFPDIGNHRQEQSIPLWISSNQTKWLPVEGNSEKTVRIESIMH